MLYKQEILQLLAERHISYELTEHQAVYNMAELEQVELPYPEANAKNLLLRDDKQQNYYLLSVKGDKRVDLKGFRKEHKLRPLSFASAEDLWRLLGLSAGAVTPLGLLNDEQRQVQFFLDADFLSGEALIGVHPNDNTATLWLSVHDLMALLTTHGTLIELVSIP